MRGSSASATSAAANDIPFFLEFVGYDEGLDEKGPEYARKKPDIVIGSMREFSKDRYSVDVLKVEVPVNMKFVEGSGVFGGSKVYSKEEAKAFFRRAPMSPPSRSSTCRPASATPSSPRRWSSRPRQAPVSRACSAAAPPGRTVFRSTPSREPTRSASGCRTKASRTSTNVNAHLKAAHPWYEFYGVSPPMHWQARPSEGRDARQRLFRISTPLTLTETSVAGVRHANRVRTELCGAGQRDGAGEGSLGPTSHCPPRST